MLIWNGKDVDGFLIILEAIEQEQTIEVAGSDGKTNIVSTFEDVRSLLPPRNEQTELTQQEYEDVLRTFMPSKEMREFLSLKELRRYQVMDLILGAPVPLKIKAEYCCRLMCHDDIFHSMLDDLSSYLSSQDYETDVKLDLLKWHTEHSFSAHEREIRSALDALELMQGEFFLLREAWYDEDYSEDNEGRRSVPLLSLDAALRYIRDEMEEEKWEDDTECWTILEKWGPGQNGETEHLYTYYLIGDEIVFFEKKKRDSNDHWLWRTEKNDYALDSQNLNLPIPFQPGDIVTVDCLPFAPVKHALLLEVGSDCCGVSALFRREDGKWDTGALKHGHCWGKYRPMLSPLYRIRSYNSQILFQGEDVLFHVQKYVARDAEKGKSLWDAFCHSSKDGLRDKEVLALVGDTHGDDVLLEYKAEHKICYSDVWDVWPWYVVDTEVQLNHANDDELVFTLFSPGRDVSKVVFWDKGQHKASLISKGRNCYDAVRFSGWVFALSVTERPDGSLNIDVRQWDDQSELGITCHYMKIDSSDRWPDIRLEVEDDILLVMLNGERYATIIPNDWSKTEKGDL